MFKAMRYFDVYILCQAANRLLQGGFERNVAEFFEPLFESYEEIIQFGKHSLLHKYCDWVINQNMWFEKEEGEDFISFIREFVSHPYLHDNPSPLWIDCAINHYCGSSYNFIEWIKELTSKTIEGMADVEISNQRYDYLCELQLSKEYEKCTAQLSSEMFYILFQNREFLYNFNSGLSAYNPNVQSVFVKRKMGQSL